MINMSKQTPETESQTDVRDYIRRVYPDIAGEDERRKKNIDVGKNLALMRTKSKLTRRQIADAINVDRTTIARLESGKINKKSDDNQILEKYALACSRKRYLKEKSLITKPACKKA